MLSPLLEAVNIVSAPILAKERNIDVTEVLSETVDEFQTLIRLTVATEMQERVVAGTLFQGNRPRLVEIKGITIDAELGSSMLYITNKDRPGFIGSVGTTLSQADINIATFNLGRNKSGGDAIALVETDGAVPDETIKRLRQLPHVVRVTQLVFD